MARSSVCAPLVCIACTSPACHGHTTLLRSLWPYASAPATDAETVLLSRQLRQAGVLQPGLTLTTWRRFWGYEMSTEGDCFVHAFHDPMDAVAWAITTQQALLTAPWPRPLERHEKTCIRLTPAAAAASAHCVQGHKPALGSIAMQSTEVLLTQAFSSR